MAGTYNIGTQKGNDLYEQVKRTGVSAKTSDGSTLSLGADGNVYAFQNGNKLLVQNNYTPTSGGAGAVSTPYSTAAKATTTPSTGTYSIGTPNGSTIYNQVMTTGQRAQMSDGTILSKGADGQIYAFQNGNKLLAQDQYASPASGAAAGTYVINTQKGSDLVEQVKRTGNSATTTDGSILSLGADGNVYAFQNGNKLLVQNNYDPNRVDLSNANSIATALMALYTKPNTSYLANQRKATDAAVNRAVQELGAQKDSTNVSYANLFRQLYLNKMRDKRDLDQQLAAQGITGGAAETTRLGVDTSYADALRQGEIERLNTIAGLDRAATDTRLQGDISYAQAAAAEAQQRQNSYANLLSSLLSRQDALDSEARQWAREDSGTAQQQAYKLALSMLTNGQMPDDATLAASGISREAAAVLRKSVTPSDQSVQYALAAAELGDRSAAVREVIERYFGLPLETVLSIQKAYGY